MSNYGWTNDQGEPIMDGAAYRFEQQLDADYAEDRARMQWDDDFYADYPEEEHVLDYDDTNEDETPWCYGCDNYADNDCPAN